MEEVKRHNPYPPEILYRLRYAMPNDMLAYIINQTHTDTDAPQSMRDTLGVCHYVTVQGKNTETGEPETGYLFYHDDVLEECTYNPDTSTYGVTSMYAMIERLKEHGETVQYEPIAIYHTLNEYVNDLPNLKDKITNEYHDKTIDPVVFFNDKELHGIYSVLDDNIEYFRIADEIYPHGFLSATLGDGVAATNTTFHYSELAKLDGTISIMFYIAKTYKQPRKSRKKLHD